MKILCACEESQTVTKAFRELGHEAYSCDILPPSGGRPEWHIQGDVLPLLNQGWDMLLAFPPCTYLSYAAIKYWNQPGRAELRQEGMDFFMNFINAPVDKICVENPVGYPNTVYRKPDQIIHPYYFGDPHVKRTCLWLKNLPPLSYDKENIKKPDPIYIDKSGKPRYHTDAISGFSKNAKILRSKFWPSIARQMALQWGKNV